VTDLQHVNVKLFATPESRVNWPDLPPIFHRWIQEQVLDGLLIDVADYAHVPGGPGILLIAHEGFYSVDNRENRLGFLYNRRAALDGSVSEKVEQAWSAAAGAARKLEAEPVLGGALHFRKDDCEVTVNDRMLAPNTQETFDRLAPAIAEFFAEKFGNPVTLDWNPDPRQLFRVQVRPAGTSELRAADTAVPSLP
jgi:hypothetical protein